MKLDRTVTITKEGEWRVRTDSKTHELTIGPYIAEVFPSLGDGWIVGIVERDFVNIARLKFHGSFGYTTDEIKRLLEDLIRRHNDLH